MTNEQNEATVVYDKKGLKWFGIYIQQELIVKICIWTLSNQSIDWLIDR